MTPDDTHFEADSSAAFERKLADLIATAFARGTAVERTWTVTVPVSDAPNWTVEIARTHDGGDAGYDPDLLDE